MARAASRVLPAGVNDCIGLLWSRQMYDWSRTRFFALPDEQNGCVRVNLRGREPKGIVEPGSAYERLLDQLETSFRRVVELETGLPIVRSVTRVDRLIDVNAPGRAYLPDLIIEWGGHPMGTSPGVRIPGIGEVRWERGGRTFSGRSGAHSPDGWLVVCDPAVAAGSRAAAAPAAALVPSLLGAIDTELLSGDPAGRTFVALLDRLGARGATDAHSGAAYQRHQLAAPQHTERQQRGERKRT
jgi:predicted AlkP superfamily phosphohydrolase/phosphomutase